MLLVALTGCASPGDDPAVERRRHAEEVRALQSAHDAERTRLNEQVARLEDDAAVLRRDVERLQRELRASKVSRVAEARSLDAALKLVKKREQELATLEASLKDRPPTADGAVALLLEKDKQIRALRDRIVQLEAGDAPPASDPEHDGIVTAAGVDLEVPVARVDGRALTRREFVEYLYRDLGAPHLLDLFVNRHLILAEAERRKLSVSDVDVEVWVADQAQQERQRAGSDEALAKRLAELGFSREAWEARLRFQAEPALLMNRLIATSRKTPEGRDAFERRLREAYAATYTERVVASHVFVRLSPQAAELDERAAFAKADAAYRELTRGVDFAAVARRYSEDSKSRELGGQLGTFGRQRFAELPRLNTVLFTIPVGQVSAPVRSALGVHVVRVDKRLPPERPFDAAVRRELIARLEKEPPSEGEVKVLLERLRSRARIETSLSFE